MSLRAYYRSVHVCGFKTNPVPIFFVVNICVRKGDVSENFYIYKKSGWGRKNLAGEKNPAGEEFGSFRMHIFLNFFLCEVCSLMGMRLPACYRFGCTCGFETHPLPLLFCCEYLSQEG